MNASTGPRVAVISGGTAGIGFAIARRQLDTGDRVAIFSRDNDRVEHARNELSEEYGADRVFARAVDLHDPADIAGFFVAVAEHWAPPSVLICNAGISPKRPGGRTPVAEIPLAEWNDVMAVNLTGPLLCCQAALPGMVSGRFGRIVLLGSLAARATPRAGGASYVASKAALSGLARTLVGDYAMYGITANVVSPGRILTGMTGAADSQVNRDALARIPTGRLGTPDDVAAVVQFLASESAGFVNGAVIDVTGGEFLPV